MRKKRIFVQELLVTVHWLLVHLYYVISLKKKTNYTK